MSDEEKKAIESLIEIREFANLSSYKDTKISQLNAIDVVLNLIEKQSKEIEELKNGQIDFWISDKEIEERIRNKFVSNDKIKAKIEELEKLNDEATGTGYGFAIYYLQSLLEKE